MIATCIIEVALAVYALVRYRQSAVRNLTVAIFVFLATFQLAEFFVCGGLGFSALVWSRVGYAAITVLPPLALALVGAVTRRQRLRLLVPVWVAALILTGFFVVAPTSVNDTVCAGNYVIFHLNGINGWWYAAYYYAVIMLCLIVAGDYIAGANDQKRRAALRWFIIGVLAFLVPTATVNALDPRTLAGIPSVMCGFAVLFALFLGFRVLPLTAHRRIKAAAKR